MFPTPALVLALVAVITSTISSVSAHGFLRSITIDGKTYKGNTPNVSNLPSPIRVINDITPVKGADNRAVNCGKDAAIAAEVAPAQAGSTVEFDWAGGDGGKWPHNIGPMLTYMSTCGNDTCDKFDAINAQWFKIDQVGQRPNKPSEWVQRDLFMGKKTAVKLPQDLPAGQYLLRHEIIALHLGNSVGGAEFYPSCSQISVSSSSAKSLSDLPSDTVSLPGAYKDTDPGIFVPTVFDPVKDYQFPGPAISSVASDSADDNKNNGTVNTTPSACSSTVRPRRISRIMTKFKRVGLTDAISV